MSRDSTTAVLVAIDDLTRLSGFPPTVRELADVLGWSSTKAVAEHLHALEDDGLIQRKPGLARTLQLTPDGHNAVERLRGEGPHLERGERRLTPLPQQLRRGRA